MDREEGHLPFVRLIARGKQFSVYPLHARKDFRDFPPLLGYVKRNDGLYPLDTQGNGTANFSQTRPEGEAKEEEKGTESHRWNKWLFLLCLLAVLFLLFTILRVLLPILLPVLLVLFVISLFKKE